MKAGDMSKPHTLLQKKARVRRPTALACLAVAIALLRAPLAFAEAAAAGAATVSPVPAAPQVVRTRHASRDWVIASEVFAPPATGGADAAPALQAVIDKVSASGGGTVFLPAGSYGIGSRVVVREGVTLRGDAASGDPAGSTLLRITADEGRENAPAAFTLERGSGLVGLAFWYPGQRLPDPVPYPWTVSSAEMSANDNQTIADCTFVNAWKAVRIGTHANELHTLRNLRICALSTGICLDSTYDIGRLSEVTVAPEVWSGSGLPGAPRPETAGAWLLQNDTVAVDIGRSDWEYIWRLSVRGYRRGLVFRKGLRGVTNAVMADSSLSGCGTALEVRELNQIGFSAYGCAFSGTVAYTDSSCAAAQFHSCSFEGAVTGTGSGVLSFQACELSRGGIDARGGQLLAQDSALGEVRIGSDVTRVRLLGFDARAARILNAATNADVAVAALNPLARPRAALRAAEPPAFPRPQSEALFVVTDFGASEASADNAAAFQAALDAAGANDGGGTVYVPAGLYTFRHDLVVPSCVELRGCFDVPHHTVSAGSVLMVRHNQGAEEGTPFVCLKPGSGLRGLTFWYPEQPLTSPVPYPWTVRSLGKRCWLKDVTIGNAWQAVDFHTHRSDNHRISYLAGAMYRRGLFVGNCEGRGWVEDVQLNPHYAARLPEKLPRVYGSKAADVDGSIIQFQRERLEGLVFEECVGERLRGTFLFAAFDGLAFRGRVHAQVLMHGTDTASRGVTLRTARGSEIDFALAQLVSLGDWAQASIVTLPGSKGVARFYNSQMWAGPATALLEGDGTVRLEQFNTLTGPVEARAGRLEAVNGVFERDLSAHVLFSAQAEGQTVGMVSECGPLRVRGGNGRVRAFADAVTAPFPVAPPAGLPTEYASSFEPGEPQAVTDCVAQPGGGIRGVKDNRCRAVPRADAHSGGFALLLQGCSVDPAYSFVYQVVSDSPVFVMPDTTLSYWMKPLNANSRTTALDLLFSDGSVLRESHTAGADGLPTFPGVEKGRVGEWTRMEVPLGKFAGRRIERIMAAYDSRTGGGPVEVLFDDVRVGTELPPAAWQIRVEPRGGRIPADAPVTIVKDPRVRVRYTLDGSVPDGSAPLYEQPLAVSKKGVSELRYVPLKDDGGMSSQVFGMMFEVE